jgi:diguanylate cyclase (GGDEF)-like protein
LHIGGIDWQTLTQRQWHPVQLEHNLHRLKLAAPLAPPVNLLHIWMFWGRPAQSANEALWLQGIILAHAGMLLFFGLLALAAWWLDRRPQRLRLRQACITVGILGTLGFAALISSVDQLVTSNITPLLVGCTLVALVFLHRPLAALLLFATTLGLFIWAIGQTQSDPALLLSNRVNGLSICAIAMALAWSQWHHFVKIQSQQQRLETQQALLEQQNARLSYLAEHDPLSGLLNRRAFGEIVTHELLRAERNQQPLCLLMLDLDHFKQINDQYGHPLGDRVIRQTAALLASLVRASDSLARIGGEEFVLLLPDCDLQQGRQVAELLRQNVEQQLRRVDGLELALTVSIGLVAIAAGQACSYERLYAASDRALYQAKHSGRNRVEGVPLD